tara:strand:+ start:2763 stop:4430 length:1668 start_codon:yes stop_codon:yes gene_type:complete
MNIYKRILIMKNITHLVFAGILLIGQQVPAYAKAPQDNLISAIPDGFYGALRSSDYIEDFKNKLFVIIRKNKLPSNNLTTADVLKFKEKILKEAGEKQSKKFAKFDLNSDSNIEKKEVEEYVKKNDARYKRMNRPDVYLVNNVNRIMVYDIDQDGIISNAEREYLTEDLLKERGLSSLQKKWEVFDDLMSLDPNKDEKLTYTEIEVIAENIFRIIDTNKDNHFSREEKRHFQDAMSPHRSYLNRQVSKEEKEKQQREKCKVENFKAPENLVVYAAGGYKGRDIEFQIEANRKATQFDVVVNETKAPVALILGAYEPAIWNLRLTPGTKVLAIIAGGYHRQAIANISKKIPVTYSTYNNHEACGLFYFNINEPETLSKANEISELAFGRKVKKFFPPQNSELGEIVIGSKGFDHTKLIYSKENSPEQHYLSTAPYSGKKGLEHALQSKLIRKATEEEVKRWNDERYKIDLKLSKKYKKLEGFGPPILKLSTNAYTIIDENFTIPHDVSASFIVLEHKKIPKGPYGKSGIYDLNTLKCITSSPFHACQKARYPIKKN